MKFAILAAGEGSRLSGEGLTCPKPLVELNGEKMIDRLVRIFSENDASEIIVIVNQLTDKVEIHLKQLRMRAGLPPIRIVAKTTPGSMHSFFALSPYLRGERFCLTTVDTVFREADFSAYLSAFKEMDADGLMAVTDFVDDEKPLYVQTAPETTRITGFFDTPVTPCLVSGGIYCLSPVALNVLDRCMDAGMVRMRDFQRTLVREGLRLYAYRFPKIMDVDHVDDIAKAEAYLAGGL